MNSYSIHKLREFEINDVDKIADINCFKIATANTKEFYYCKSTTSFDAKVKNGELKVVLMKPEEYIQQASFIQGRKVKDVIRDRLEDIYKDIYTNKLTGENTISKLMTLMHNNVLIFTPYYTIDYDFQDGFHRSMAAYLLGVEYEPVIINKKSLNEKLFESLMQDINKSLELCYT